MTSHSRRPRFRLKVKHIITSTMLCCGRKKEARETATDYQSTEETSRRAGPFRPKIQHGQVPEMVVQSDFRKVSGITTEIFRQIEAIEKQYDATTAANLETVEKRGDMIIRLLDPNTLGRAGSEACRNYTRSADSIHIVQFVEIIKRPGQTLGLYIREGETSDEGVFISRIALESAVYNSGLLKVGDEILAVNLVDVRHVSLDDVVIIMSIPRRLVLTIRSRICGGKSISKLSKHRDEETRPPIVVVKKGMEDDTMDDYGNNHENGMLLRARVIGIPSDMSPIGITLEPRHSDDRMLYYNSQPAVMAAGGRVPKLVEDIRAGDERTWPRTTESRIVTRQPIGQQKYPKTLESLAEQIHSFHAAPHQESRRSLFPSSHTQIQFPRLDRNVRNVYWDEQTATLGRTTRLLRTESEQRISTVAHDNFDRYSSIGIRHNVGVSATMQPRGRLRRYDELSQSMAALRRRIPQDSSSDTEVQSGAGRDGILARQSQTLQYQQQQFGMPNIPRGYGQLRSNSLPRVRTTDQIYRRPQQAVRFDKHLLPYDSQDDSDGALSAPELPASKPGRRGTGRHGPSPPVTSPADYRAWLSRAPSTSAIYEKVRRAQGVRHTTLPRVAHSAESLLDTLRQDEQRGIQTLMMYPRRPPLRTPAENIDKTTFLTQPLALEYIRQVPNPTPVKPSEDRLQLLTLNPRDYVKYRVEKDSETVLQNDGFSGLLWIHLVAGRGLRPTSHSDHFRDLYCVIECDRVHKARTVVRTGEHSFDWDEVFDLDLVENTELSFLLYSWDPQYRHKLCYKGTIHLLTILRESPIHSLALKMEPRGTLYVKLRYRDPRQTFQRLPASSDKSLYGVDLETVVIRENSGYAVPRIIKRCIEEVEKRGLDIVGIYRLCGSDVRKKMLREAFERNSLIVDLSIEHVPDINVVTSLLKDYLRELPEPLFTKGLFDMLVDGFSVCLPDDPEGNAKLMFSILECLPKINRFTVLFLMDHLKLITCHSDRNKMTPQILAVCFGPIVMCHTETGSPVSDLKQPIDVFRYLLEIWPAKRENDWCVLGSDSSGSSNTEQPEPTPTVTSTAANQVNNSNNLAKKSVTWIGQRPLPESSC